MPLDIEKYLVPKVRARFGDRPIDLAIETEFEMIFPCVHPEFGDIAIYDDGNEITVFVGNFTHTHFPNYDEELSDSERAANIAEDVMEFLEDVFADRIEFYGSQSAMGGWRFRKDKPRGFLARALFGGRYVWSGPLED